MALVLRASHRKFCQRRRRSLEKYAECLTAHLMLTVARLSDIRDPQTYAIIGAAIEVHRVLGCGFLEKVYRVALFEELQANNVPCRAEVSYRIPYKGRPLRVYYRADIVCFDAVIVEVKASVALTRIDHAQAINYLKVSGLHRALLLNFGTRMLQYQRLVLGL